MMLKFPNDLFEVSSLMNQLESILYNSLNQNIKLKYNLVCGPLAQWLELPAHNRSVAGSSPAGSTILI
jgi:hypothetical protein